MLLTLVLLTAINSFNVDYSVEPSDSQDYGGHAVSFEVESQDEELMELIEQYITERSVDEDRIGIAYYNTVTGKSVGYNEDALFYPGSVYKLPLNMYYYEQEALGVIDSDTLFWGHTLSRCHEITLQYSHNETAEAMRQALGTVSEYKELMRKYGGMSDEDLGEEYFSSFDYSAEFMLNTIKYMYDNSGFFAEAIGYLECATAGKFFELSVPDDECMTVQKYGWFRDEYGRVSVNAVGIIYAEQPYLLCVFTENVSLAETFIGDINLICYNYVNSI